MLVRYKCGMVNLGSVEGDPILGFAFLENAFSFAYFYRVSKKPMKKCFAFLFFAGALVACNNATESAVSQADSAVKAAADSVKAALDTAVKKVDSAINSAVDSTKSKVGAVLDSVKKAVKQ
jgi:hypothetical protein